MTALVLLCLGLVLPDDGAPPAGKSPQDAAAYREAAGKAGPDAASQIRLALWCEAHGMTAERVKHLAAVVLSDPANALARGLMGMVARGGKWERPEEVSREVREDPKQKALMEEYLQRRARAADKADEQWKLATWCEQNGLKEQAVAHYHAVLRLDPKRDAVWKHLGFKKVGGRWTKPEWQEVARSEAEEQDRANKHWRPILERWRSGLSSREGSKRADAEAGLLGMTDPRAVPMVWAVFVTRRAEGHRVAVRVLGRIDSPGSSRALTLLALGSPAADVRGQAIQILRGRDPRDFAPMLIALLKDRIRYEVRRVNGPGSPGELLIKGQDVNVDRLYSPPPMPFIPIRAGDSMTLDSAGLPVITRFLGTTTQNFMVPGNSLASAWAVVDQHLPNSAPPTSFNNLGLPANVAARLNTLQAQSLPSSVRVNFTGTGPHVSVTASQFFSTYEQIPVGQIMLQSQMAAQSAEQQLEGDVQAIQAYNAAVQGSNQRVLQVLNGATGVDLGDDPTAWQKWIVDLFGFGNAPSYSSAERPTVVEQVPLAYQPQYMPPTVFTQGGGFDITVSRSTHSCFGAGTPVRTLDGPRPIESLRPGDLVLTQDPRSGGLRYQAIVMVYHNRPNATFRIATGPGDAIVATGIHRLWKAGKGWTMARELRPGDILRTLGGVATVKSVEADRVQPVFNLQVADGESYFVGQIGVLAHDNSTINPVPEPFDTLGPLTATAASAPAYSSPRPRSMLGR